MSTILRRLAATTNTHGRMRERVQRMWYLSEANKVRLQIGVKCSYAKCERSWKIQLFKTNCFKEHFSTSLYVNLPEPSPHSDSSLLPGNHNVHNFEFTLHKNASAHVSALLADLFLKKIFLNCFFFSIYIHMWKFDPPPPHCGPTLTLGSWLFKLWNLHYLRMIAGTF